MSTETTTPDESLATSAEHPVLSVQGVVKRFGSNIVLRRLDLDVHRHEVVVLLGASGSGKSTLLRCANLLERVDDVGVGLGLNTPIGPLRLDYGRGSQGGRVHFRVGGTF